MTPDLRSLLVRLLDAWGGKEPYDSLKQHFDELRAELIADDDRRKLLAACITTERLDESAEFKAANRRAQRLHMAYDLFRSLVAGCWSSAIGPGNSTDRIRQFAWEQADKFLVDADKPTPPPVQHASASTPSKGLLDAYLRWMAEVQNGTRLVGVQPMGDPWTPELAARCHREALKHGLVAAVDATSYGLTLKGWNCIDPLPAGNSEVLKLSECDEAA